MSSQVENLKQENDNLKKAHQETLNELAKYIRVNSDLNELIIHKNIEIAELKIRIGKYENRDSKKTEGRT